MPSAKEITAIFDPLYEAEAKEASIWIWFEGDEQRLTVARHNTDMCLLNVREWLYSKLCDESTFWQDCQVALDEIADLLKREREIVIRCDSNERIRHLQRRRWNRQHRTIEAMADFEILVEHYFTGEVGNV